MMILYNETDTVLKAIYLGLHTFLCEKCYILIQFAITISPMDPNNNKLVFAQIFAPTCIN